MSHDVQITRIGSQKDVLEISIRGILDTTVAYSLQKEVHKLIDEGQYRYLINLEKLEQISSAGIGFFSELVVELRKHQGDLVFVNIPEHVQHVLKITRLFELFTVCDTVAAALDVMNNARQSA